MKYLFALVQILNFYLKLLCFLELKILECKNKQFFVIVLYIT